MSNPPTADDQDTSFSQDEPHPKQPSSEQRSIFGAADKEERHSLIARYRAQRGLPDYPSRHGERPQFQTLRDRSRMAVARHGQSNFRNDKPSRRSRVRLVYVVTALAAVALGAGGGYGVAQFGEIKKIVATVIESFGSATNITRPDTASQQSTGETVVAKKPMPTAKLEVSDVSGRVNSLIPLALKAEPAMDRQDLLLKISGLPEKAYLTTGRKEADQVWELTLAELQDVKLVVPQASAAPRIDVAVAAFERGTGKLAAPIRTMTIALADAKVVPAAAPPPQSMLPPPDKATPGHASAIPRPDSSSLVVAAREQAAARLVAKGDTLLKTGDFAAARRLYEQAWSSGAAIGAMAMGRSYDPLMLAQLQLRGGEPDSSKAIAWYQRAAAAGESAAFPAIVRLKVKP